MKIEIELACFVSICVAMIVRIRELKDAHEARRVTITVSKHAFYFIIMIASTAILNLIYEISSNEHDSMRNFKVAFAHVYFGSALIVDCAMLQP